MYNMSRYIVKRDMSRKIITSYNSELREYISKQERKIAMYKQGSTNHKSQFLSKIQIHLVLL